MLNDETIGNLCDLTDAQFATVVEQCFPRGTYTPEERDIAVTLVRMAVARLRRSKAGDIARGECAR